MKSLLILMAAGATLLTGCATTLQARSDHDASQDFSRYRTYTWMADQPMIVPPDGVAGVSPLNRKRIEEAIENTLAARGFQKAADRATADFVIAYSVGARDRIEARSFPAPYAGIWHWGRRYYGQEVDVDAYREGTLAIDVFDGRTHQPVWHGWATKRITEEDVRHASERIPEAVTAILARFPPR